VAQREDVERLTARVAEMEDALRDKTSRIAELEAKLFTERMRCEEAVREAERRHDDAEAERLRARQDDAIEEARRELERRAEDERRIARSVAEENRRAIQRCEEARDRDVRALRDDVDKLKRDLDEASTKRRELEVELRDAGLKHEEALRYATQQRLRVEEELKREISSVRSMAARSEDSAISEMRAKEKAIDEKIALTREITDLRAQLAKLQAK
jgi:hypothetical protein